MKDRIAGPPIDLEKVEAQRKRVAELAEAALAHLGIGGRLDWTLRLLGRTTFGEDQQIITGPDGKSKKVDWSLDDINKAWEERGLTLEKQRRDDLIREIEIGIDFQDGFFTSSKSKHREAGLARVQFARAFVQRYSWQEITVKPEYGPPDEAEKQFEFDEEAMQSLKKILLPEVGGFVYQDNPMYEERLRELLGFRRLRDWLRVSEAEGVLFKDYLNELSRRAVDRNDERLDLLRRLHRQGQRVYSDEELAPLEERTEETRQIADEINSIVAFDGLVPWVKERYGEGADFSTVIAGNPETETPTVSNP